MFKRRQGLVVLVLVGMSILGISIGAVVIPRFVSIPKATPPSLVSVLLVVDMQPRFAPSRDPRVVENCLREIRRAKGMGWDIVFLEYLPEPRDFAPSSPTDNRLLEAVKTYPMAYRIFKDRDDGSPALASFLDRQEQTLRQCRICGVNRSFCIDETAKGIQVRWPAASVTIAEDACNDAPK